MSGCGILMNVVEVGLVWSEGGVVKRNGSWDFVSFLLHTNMQRELCRGDTSHLFIKPEFLSHCALFPNPLLLFLLISHGNALVDLSLLKVPEGGLSATTVPFSTVKSQASTFLSTIPGFESPRSIAFTTWPRLPKTHRKPWST
jgi:hypothetical protein